MDKSLSRWAGRLLILAMGLLLALALVLAAALVIFDDEDYRDALIWAAEQYLDVKLAIDGELSLELGPTLGLHAQGLRLRTNDGRVTASVTDLATQLQLRPLLSKTIWLDGLTFVGAQLEIHHPPDRQDDRRADGLKGLPKIILHEARLLDVALVYHDAENTVHEVHIDQLLIDDSADPGPVIVDGRGEFNGQQIELAGTLGSREQLLDPATPYPLALNLNSGNLSANLAGTIADPIEGRGLDLQMSADGPDLAASLALLGQQTPPLGALQIEARIGGNYESLSFEQITLSLRHDERLDVRIEGKIGNIQALSGLDLEIDGSIDDAKVWHWLTAGKLSSVDHGAVRGSVSDQSGKVRVDLTLEVGTLSVDLTGTIADPIKGRGIDLQMTANDPEPAASAAILGYQVPPLGTLQLEGKLGGDYDVLRFEQMKLSLQRGEQLDVKVEGRIGNIQAISGLNLEISGTIDDAEIWRWLTADRLPTIHSGTVHGTLSDQAGVFRASNLNLEGMSETGAKLGVKGTASIDPRTTPLSEPDIDLALMLSAPTLTAIKALVDHDVPELGPVQLTARLSGRPPLLRFEALDATVGDQKQHRFTFENGHGKFDLHKEPQLQMARIPMTATTPRPAGLARLFGVDTPKLGRTTAEGTWSVDGSTIKLEQFDSSIQLPGGATHRLAGTIEHQIGQSTRADVEFDLDTDRLLALWIANTPGELGRIAGSIELFQRKDAWQVNRLQLDSTQTDLFQLNVTGKGGARKISDPQEMGIRLQIDDPRALLVTAGFAPLALSSIDVDGSLTAHQGQYRYRGNLVAGKSASQLNLTATYTGDRPVVSGEMKTPLLVLADIGLSVEGTEALQESKDKETPKSAKRKDGEPRTLFSREPLNLAWLQKLDLDVSVQIDELRGAELEIDEAKGRITLESGRLRLRQTDFRYFGGTASGYYEIDARAVPVFRIDARADNLALGKILVEFLPNTIKGGIMDLELKLEGRGRSAHQVASSLHGALDIAFENSRIPSAYVEFLSADILGWTVGRTPLTRGYSRLDCGIVGLDIASGVAESHALLADGPNLGISGNANVDLGAETLDLVLLPDQKSDVFINATPVKISGSLLDPTVEAIPTRAATKRIGRMVLLPQVFVPLEVLSQGWRLLGGRSRSSPGCTKVLGRSVEEGFAFEGAQPQAAN